MERPPENRPLSRRQALAWLWRLPVLGAALALGAGAWQAYRVHFRKLEPVAEPAFYPLTPQRIALLDDLTEVWAARDFAIGGIPAVVVRLPEAVPGGLVTGGKHFAAYSRVCTHLGCEVVYRRDTETVALAFNYRSNEPSLTCPCHLSVFAPAQGGQAVSGPAVEPLLRVKLRHEEGALYAVGLEQRG